MAHVFGLRLRETAMFRHTTAKNTAARAMKIKGTNSNRKPSLQQRKLGYLPSTRCPRNNKEGAKPRTGRGLRFVGTLECKAWLYE